AARSLRPQSGSWRSGEDEARAEQAERLAPSLGVRAVEHQLSVEVVDLVLDDPGSIALELEREGRTVGIERLDPDLGRTLDRHPHRAERQASLGVVVR